MRSAFIAALVFSLSVHVWAQAVGQPPSPRKYSVVRLQPTAFPELPRNLVTELERQGCTIPQPYTDRRANVIHGEFATPGQKDWAVLCSTMESTSILVFWNGSALNPTELARNPYDPGRIDLFIRAADRKFILDHYRAYDGPKPPPIIP